MLEDVSDLPNDLHLISFDPANAKNSLKIISGKLILVIGQFRVVKYLDARIGNPVVIPPEAWNFPGQVFRLFEIMFLKLFTVLK